MILLFFFMDLFCVDVGVVALPLEDTRAPSVVLSSPHTWMARTPRERWRRNI